MSQSVIFQYLSAGSFDVTVPSGFSNQVLVYAWGAGGGTGTGAPGGGGGYAAGVVTIDAGDSVVISVGGAGGSIVGRTAAGSAGGTGNNPIVDLSGGVGAPGGDPEDNDAGGAGGGGGASAIFVNGVPMLVAAGAGGGGGLGEDWGGGDYENGKGRPGGVATQVTTTPRGANGRKGGAGGAGGGGGGYPFGGDSQRNLYGDDVYSISQGGFGGQNYANATVTSSSLVAGSGINPGGTNNGFYPGKSRGKATFDGCVIVVFQKLFTAWIKQSGAWKQVTNAYVKTGNTTLTTTRTVAVSPGTTVSTVAGSQNIIGIGATNWTVPSGVTSLSIVAIGGGGGGGSVGTTTVPIAVTKTVNYTTDLWTRSTNNELIAWIEGINISSALVDSAERASYLARLNTAFDSSVPVGSIIPTSTLATLKSYFNSALNTIFDSYNSDINKLISLPIYVQNLEDGAFGSGTSFTYESNIYTRSTSQGAATFTISIGTSERTLLANELKSALGSLYTSYSASSIERAFLDGFIAFFVSLVVDQFNGISSSVTLYNYTITPLTGGAITTVSGGGGGGSGGVTTGTLAVTPGEVIRVDVGSGGAVSGAATVVRATSGTITASGGGKGSAGTASAGGAGGSTATGGSIGSTGGYSPTGGTVAGGAGGSTSRGYGNGGAGASNTTAASAGASGAVLISYTQSIITTGPSTTTVPVTTTVSVGGWKQIVRGWMKKDGVWKDISTPLTLESSRVATTPSTRARINIVIASNTTSYNLLDTLNSLGTYYPGYSDITLTINAGVVVDSDTAGGAALTVDGLTSGDSLIIVNNGTIRGRGGAGGASGWLKTTTVGSGKNTTTSTSVQPAYPGGAGGTGLAITYIATLENNGNIYAGGGGGGGGGISYNGAGGGQGGGGAGFGPGANAGTATTGGAGSGNGGAGGSNGANGTAGTNGATVTVTSNNGKGSSQVAGSAGGAGGIGGKAIVGYAKLTVTVEGTIVGPRA